MPGGTEEVYTPFDLRIEYKLKNGKTVNRIYDVYPLSEAGQVLESYYTSPECVLGFAPDRVREMTKYIHRIYVDGMDQELYDLEGLDLEGMLNAIIADCEAGNMAQYDGFHYPANYSVLENPEQFDFLVAYLEIGWDRERMANAMIFDSTGGSIVSYRYLRIYQSCTNTIGWMEENGLLTEETKRELVKRYGGPTEIFETTG